jgi:hypothetical protein
VDENGSGSNVLPVRIDSATRSPSSTLNTITLPRCDRS